MYTVKVERVLIFVVFLIQFYQYEQATSYDVYCLSIQNTTAFLTCKPNTQLYVRGQLIANPPGVKYTVTINSQNTRWQFKYFDKNDAGYNVYSVRTNSSNTVCNYTIFLYGI